MPNTVRQYCVTRRLINPCMQRPQLRIIHLRGREDLVDARSPSCARATQHRCSLSRSPHKLQASQSPPAQGDQPPDPSSTPHSPRRSPNPHTMRAPRATLQSSMTLRPRQARTVLAMRARSRADGSQAQGLDYSPPLAKSGREGCRAVGSGENGARAICCAR